MKPFIQKEVAELAGVSRSYLNDILKGRRPCSKQMAAKISAATGGAVSIQELLYPDGIPEGARLQKIANQ